LPGRVLDRFVDEGILPNCTKLIGASARLDVVPTLPALTAPGWLTIASGAHPGTMGVSNILLPTPGAAPDHIRNGFDRSLAHAEYLWETLVAQGRSAVVLKYPGSWPPIRPAEGQGALYQVDGAGGYADITCRFEEVPSAAYLSGIAAPDHHADGCCSVPRGYDDHWRIDGAQSAGHRPVTARDPVQWTGLPDDLRPVFEVVLPLQPVGQRQRTPLHALAAERSGRPVLVVAPAKDYAVAVAELAVGDWSDWLHQQSRRGSYAVRLKLIELDLAGRRLHVYRSEGHRTGGFTVPADLADELVTAAGPVVEWTGTFDFMNGLVDLDTQLEIYDQHTAWLERAIVHLAGKPWAGFFVHWHVVEYAHHIAGAALDDRHPRHADNRDRYLAFLRDTYRLLDRLVGTAIEVAGAGAGDTFAMVSDHGHDTVHSLFFVNDFLREHGWLATADRGTDGDAGQPQVDWSRTKAYGLFPGLVLVNSADRWDGGIVGSADVPALLDDITAALRKLTDPRTGRPVVTAVLGAAELQVHGQFGATAPDLMFTTNGGYEPATRLRPPGRPVFEITAPGSELTSGHGSFHPSSLSARTLALVRHPSLLGGTAGRHPVAMADLAPTFAGLLGVRPPRHCDGRALDFGALGLLAGESAR
jgi:predicted AlkP superfamily phosphohydrolase/phosphomutase